MLGADRLLGRLPVAVSPLGPHLLVDTRSAPPSVVTVPHGWPVDCEAAPPRALGAVLVVSTGARSGYLSPRAVKAHLSARRGLQGGALTDAMEPLLEEVERSVQARVQELGAQLPGFSLPVDDLLGWLAAGARGEDLEATTLPPAAYSRSELEQLRSMQRTALSVYGCLEPERALSWAVEELGELAQAMRRHEHPARLSEELGQVFSWVLCLANICDVDLARAAGQALRHEALRQRAAYGALRPYRPRQRSGDLTC